MSEFEDYLTLDKRKEVLVQRIIRFAQDGYQYELNKKFALASGDNNALEEADTAIKDLKIAIEIHEQELKSL